MPFLSEPTGAILRGFDGGEVGRMMNAVGSRYRIREGLFGFEIEGTDRPPVAVVFHSTGWEAWYVEQEAIRERQLPGGCRERFGFFNFGKLVEFVARGLMREWQPSQPWCGWHGARQWAQTQTARAIARRLREQWQRLLAQADPTVLAVQKAVFAATFGDAPLLHEPALYQDTYLVRDIVRFPAAAIAVRNAWVLTRDLPLRSLAQSPQAMEVKRLAREMGLQVSLVITPPEDPSPAAQLARLADWKALFADTGQPYRSLNRTLMNLPGRIPHRQVCNLRFVHLERPVERRLELLTLALYAALRRAREPASEGDRPDHTHLFHHARSTQLREAMERVAEHLRLPLAPGKASDVRQFVQFLADFPERHAGNVVGLAERAIRWHRDRQHEQLAAVRSYHGPATATRPPPIALPEIPGIAFLGTVGAICTEAERMQHCVASYVDLAILGNCYLFHVEHDGEEATIEVGCEGRVRQAQGPRNQRNKAARWGRRILNRWAMGFPVLVFNQGRAELEEDIPF